MRNIFIRIGRKIYSTCGWSREAIYANRPSRKMLSTEEANEQIASRIRESTPSMISRLGSPEARAILNYLDIERYQSQSFFARQNARFQGRLDQWDEGTKHLLSNNVGFFPTTDESLKRFVPCYLSGIASMDMIAVWNFVPGESYIMRQYCKDAIQFEPSVLEPYFSEKPWSKELKNRRVLVVHPFVRSIKEQYARREKLFSNPDILPEFELQTVQAVQSLAGTKTPFQNWFDALDSMKEQIQQCKFDVALIGAGSYGLPLSSYVKKLGKIAIHMGGAVQILFGIRGKRWDEMPEFSHLFNENWIRPAPEEFISGGTKVENGCYW